MTEAAPDRDEDPEGYWEARYKAGAPTSSGRPGAALRRFAEPLAPGRALELGCGKGDDAVWLAARGWSVLAVDISATALGYAAANAERAGVVDRVTFEQHNLAESFPEGPFDLVTANFLAANPREVVLPSVARAVASGGHLLFIHHATPLPWRQPSPDRQFPTVEEWLALFALDESGWDRVHVGEFERQATGPDGETATVKDSVVFLRRH